MRIVFVGYTGNPQYKDPQQWLFRIRAYLGVPESLAKQHTVISIEQIGHTGLLERNGVQYHFIKPLHRYNYFPKQLHRFIASLSPDVILVHGMEHPLQLIHLRRTIGKKVRIIVQSHGPKLPVGIKKWVQRMADHAVDAYFFSAKQMAGQWLHHKLIGNGGKVSGLPVGSSVFQRMNKATARQQAGIGEGRVFLWVGRLDDNKDPLTVVKAFLRLASQDPTVKLYMIYQQDELLEPVQLLLQKSKTAGSIVLVGAVPHEAMQRWFCSADFFISSSYFEVYGAAVVEAMSCGCIPILSDIPAYRAITADQTVGTLYPPGDTDALFHALQHALLMDQPAEQTRTLDLFERSLSFDAIAEKFMQVVDSLGSK